MNKIFVDKLNVFLILFSLFLAIILPFELFLFSYAFLGPIHYFTEINWLNQKKYFVGERSKWMFVFLLFAAIGFTFFILNVLKIDLNFMNKSVFFNSKTLLMTALLFSIALVSSKIKYNLFLVLIISYLIVLLIRKYFPVSFYFYSVFLPTIFHVYVFTMFFMIYGVLKNKSNYGLTNIFLLIIVPLIIIILPNSLFVSNVSPGVMTVFEISKFQNLNFTLLKVFNISSNEITSVYSVKAQVFIAFAYTYHYLNWFSKTNIIGWHKHMNFKKVGLISLLSLISFSIYLYDYKLGLMTLLFFSVLHVYLEFPLNITTFKEVFKFFRQKISSLVLK